MPQELVKLSRYQAEALLIGVANNLDAGPLEPEERIAARKLFAAYPALKLSPKFDTLKGFCFPAGKARPKSTC